MKKLEDSLEQQESTIAEQGKLIEEQKSEIEDLTKKFEEGEVARKGWWTLIFSFTWGAKGNS